MKQAFALTAATIWISLSEFFRNQYLLKDLWIQHYAQQGLVFPASPVNGAFWGVWSLFFAVFIFILARKFSTTGTTLIAWLAGFGLMWICTGNLGVLPFGILWAAIPLSLLECFVATWIIRKIINN